MPRIRTIKPEFWDDEKLSALCRDSRLLFIGMWNFSDDYGVVKGNKIWLKSKIFPYDQIQVQHFEKWLIELQKLGFIIPFQANSESYYYLPNFLRHQIIDRPSKNRNPEYQDIESVVEDSTSTRLQLDEGSALEGEREEEGKGKGKGKNFTPPEISEVENYFSENGYSAEAAKKAFEYYSTANWVDSKGNKVRNWKQKMIAVWFKDENKKEKSSAKKEKVIETIEQNQRVKYNGQSFNQGY